MERVPEPEMMAGEEEAKVYSQADFSEVNQAFAERVLEVIPHPGRILIDLGCGPGDILVRIFRMAPEFFLLGLDGSKAMLAYANERIKREGLENKIYLIKGDAKKLSFPDDCFDVVISNSLVHHLLDPLPFWKEVRRVTKPEGIILIRDLCRPDTTEVAWHIVERESGAEPQLLKNLFFYSLRASFTVDEVKEQLIRAGLKSLKVRMSSDRHWEAVGKKGESLDDLSACEDRKVRK
jgi:ubiquinone/menaquinone biosynthesis C-methylase UbiE